MKEHRKISVVVITGFLGAGKTTFINTLLKSYPDKQFALVENEFGEISIDTKLIKGVDASQMFELREGCICCTISDEYELVLAELSKRFPNINYLLIETTGLADPASVIRPFFSDENLHKTYAFIGTVCLVDALNFEIGVEQELKYKQIAVADQILISKVESLPVTEKQKLKVLIKGINPLSEVQYTEKDKPTQFVLDSLVFKTKYFPEHQIKHSNVTSRILTFTKSLNKEKFVDWLSYTLDIYKNETYRVKGFLCFEDEPYEYILQGVGGSFEITEGENLVSESKSEIVFIGILKNLNLEFSF